MSDNNTDAVRHGIDDNSNDDAHKGLELGALGGGAVGATAGAAGGPIGAAVGGLIGGSVGSLVSGAAVRTVDDVDNDETLPGIGANDTSQPSEDSVDLKPIEATDANNATTPSASSDVYLDTSEPPLGTGTSGDNATVSYASSNAGPDASATETNQSAPDIVTGEPSASNAGATSSGASDVGLAGAIINGPGGAITGNDVGDGSTNNAKGTTAVAGEDTKNI